jgi:hypothetical protein
MTDPGGNSRFARTVLIGCWASITCAAAIAGEPPLSSADAHSSPDVQVISIGDLLVSELLNPADAPLMTKAPPAEQAPVINRILANWRARQQRIRTFRLAWNSWQSKLGNVNAPDAQTEAWVERDLRQRIVRSSPPNRIVSISAFDGMIRRRWDAERRAGELWNGEQWSDLNEFSARMWCTALDPLGSGLIDRAAPQFQVVKANAIIGDRHCVKLERRLEGRSWPSNIVETIWIDPERDDVIAGWERRSPEGPFFFVSIEYARDPRHGWLPARWDNTNTGTLRAASAVATRLTLDERFPIETFRFSFPPGTSVNDRGLAARYEIAANGSKANIKPYYPAEYQTIYDSLQEKTDFIVDPEPLRDALEFIAKRYHMKVAIDAEGVRRGLVDPLVEVKTGQRQMKLSALLDLLLKQSPQPLKYEIRDDVVTVLPDRN